MIYHHKTFSQEKEWASEDCIIAITITIYEQKLGGK